MGVVAARRTEACEAGHTDHTPRYVRPALAGLVAAVLLLAFYLLTIAIAQDWSHARSQLASDSWFVAAISAGFGIQVGLFVYLRLLHAGGRTGGMTASTGTSTAAMLACCAHHLADALPIVGLSGAAVFLNDFRQPILWTGISLNVLGIAYLGWKIRGAR